MARSTLTRTLLTLTLATTLAGCVSNGYKKFRSSYADKLHYGMTRTQLEDTFQQSGRLQFAILEDDQIISATQHTFIDGETYINFIFQDDILENIVEAQNHKRTRTAWTVRGRRDMALGMHTQSQTPIENFIASMLKRQKNQSELTRAEMVMWSPIYVLSSPFIAAGLPYTVPKTANIVARKSGYRKAFDPAIAKPRMTRQQLLDQFGEPHFKQLDDDSETWIYGPLQTLDPATPDNIHFIQKEYDGPLHPYWYELILQDETVTQIYSDTFFNTKTLTLQNNPSPEAQAYFTQETQSPPEP